MSKLGTTLAKFKTVHSMRHISNSHNAPKLTVTFTSPMYCFEPVGEGVNYFV